MRSNANAQCIIWNELELTSQILGTKRSDQRNQDELRCVSFGTDFAPWCSVNRWFNCHSTARGSINGVARSACYQSRGRLLPVILATCPKRHVGQDTLQAKIACCLTHVQQALSYWLNEPYTRPTRSVINLRLDAQGLSWLVLLEMGFDVVRKRARVPESLHNQLYSSIAMTFAARLFSFSAIREPFLFWLKT
jgi:hypothetical protein